MRYLLDSGIVIALQRVGHLGALSNISTKLPLLIVEEAYDEIVEPRGGRYVTESKQAQSTLDGCATTVTIDPTGEAAVRLSALRSRKSKGTVAGLGEAASIAWAFDQNDCVFVTEDVAATFLALDELRGRVITFFSFLRVAVDAGGLDVAAARAIGEATPTAQGVQRAPPSWWSTWVGDR